MKNVFLILMLFLAVSVFGQTGTYSKLGLGTSSPQRLLHLYSTGSYQTSLDGFSSYVSGRTSILHQTNDQLAIGWPSSGSGSTSSFWEQSTTGNTYSLNYGTNLSSLNTVLNVTSNLLDFKGSQFKVGNHFQVQSNGNVLISGDLTANKNLMIGENLFTNKIYLDGSYQPANYNSFGGVKSGFSISKAAVDLDGDLTTNNVIIGGYYGVALVTDKGRLTMDHDGIVTISLSNNQIQSIVDNTDETSEYKLFVADGIRTEKVKVDLETDWPDYVFADDYNLMNLEELNDYIKKYNHLPNVPNATEVKENGIELGEANKILLEKVEELTLYIIELEKRLKKLENE